MVSNQLHVCISLKYTAQFPYHGRPLLCFVVKELGYPKDKMMHGNSIKLMRVQYVRQFGALTSKPFEFTARSWELRNTDTVDCMDGIGATIQIQSKGGEVMRVLPIQNNEINEDWLNDKSRFAYDGLKRQRLTQPLVRSLDNPSKWNDVDSSWRTALKRVADNMSSSGPVRAIVGSSVDLESAVCLADWVNSFENGSVESIGSKGATAGADIVSQYRFNGGIHSLEDSDVCLVIGSNLMSEAPLLVARLRKVFLRDSLEVYNLGPATNFTFPVAQVGLTPRTLVEIAEGRHPICAKLASAKKPTIIVGSQVFDRKDGAALAGCIDAIAEFSGNFRQYDTNGNCTWNGIKVLHHHANDVGLLELGLTTPLNETQKTKGGTLFLMGVNDGELPVPLESLADENTNVVFIGHHGDQLTAKANVVLAGGAYSEKNGTYINTEGRSQQARNAITPPLDARVDWTIIRALSEVCPGKALPYNDERDIRKRLEQLVPSTSDSGDVVTAGTPTQLCGAGFSKLATAVLGGGKIDCTPFEPAIHDFYLDGHVVARASQSMAKASTELPSPNFVQYHF